MSFDGIVTRAVVQELQQKLAGSKIGKIYQPQENELVIHIRSRRETYSWMISAHPVFARTHFTKKTNENPKTPPMFCMLLRKHLEGGTIRSLTAEGLERIITVNIMGKNEIGDRVEKNLILELMGRHSNVILTENGTIIDCMKRTPPGIDAVRTLRPGLSYPPLSSGEKLNPLQVDEETVLKKVDFNSGKIDRQLVSRFLGLSPLVAKEIVYRAGINVRARLAETFCSVMADIRHGKFYPNIVRGPKEVFSVVELTHVKGEKETFSTVSAMLDEYFSGRAEKDRLHQQAYDLIQRIRGEIAKNEKKIKKLQKTIELAKNADQYRLKGELLTAQLHRVQKGDRVIEAQNYYDENGGTITITLDSKKTPAENAQAYFKKYNKLKKAGSAAKEQIEKTKQETHYLENILQQVEDASRLSDLDEIREELVEEGYFKKQKRTKKKQKKEKPQPARFISSEGILILVGKNNKQNEYLTKQLARKNDTWLHAKNIPGAHVVIRASSYSRKTLEEAAGLAAYFSKGKQAGFVPVDYTKIANVRKPNGAKPGFVIYENEKTIFASPSSRLVEQLKKSPDS